MPYLFEQKKGSFQRDSVSVKNERMNPFHNFEL